MDPKTVLATWTTLARSQGGIPAFLARPDLSKKESDPRRMQGMVLKIKDAETGMLGVTLYDEEGVKRLLFFVPRADLEQALSEVENSDDASQ